MNFPSVEVIKSILSYFKASWIKTGQGKGGFQAQGVGGMLMGGWSWCHARTRAASMDITAKEMRLKRMVRGENENENVFVKEVYLFPFLNVQ